jgi:hypothetical protein
MVGKVAAAIEYDIFDAAAFAVAILEDVNAHSEAKAVNDLLEPLVLQDSTTAATGPRGASTRRRRADVDVDLSKWNVDSLISACQAALDEFSANPDDYRDPNGYLEYFLEEISSGAAGVYQAQEIASFFDLEDVNFGEEMEEGEERDEDSAYEYFWDEIDQYIEPIARALSAELDNLPGQIYFGHLDADGSYGMFYSVSMEDFEAYEEERLSEEEMAGRDLGSPSYEAPASTDPRQTALRLEGSARRRASRRNY